MTQIRFDDSATLRAAVSEEFGPWGTQVEVTQAMIDAFADLSGDHQWIHVDVERAQRESPFGGPIAHGFLTLILFPRLEVPKAEIVGHASAVNYGIDRLRFLSPVPAGATIHGRVRLAAVDERTRGVLLTNEFEVRVVDAEKPALLCSMQALYLPGP